MTLKLNIGAGETKLDGFVPIDRMFGSEAYPLLHDDDCVDEIRASHILEHFSFADVPRVLADWVRVLKPGATIKIAVPDFDKITAMRDDKLWRFYLMGGQKHDNDYHRSLFTEAALEEQMRAAGLKNIRHWSSDNTDTASSLVSLNLQGTKDADVAARTSVPVDAEVEIDTVDSDTQADDNSILVDVVCCMSIPRVGFNDHWGCVVDVMGVLGIPITRFTGAFWGQGMQAMFIQSMEEGAEWIISLDYDSMFSLKHMKSMLSMMGRHPEIDALTCIQSRRVHNNALLTRSVDGIKQHGVYVDGSPIQCDTAHFGLTIFRATGLKDLPLPWFNAVPGPDGTWTHDDHIDDDVYFWKNWKKHDRTLYVNPNVRIGHLEMVVAGFDEDFKHRYQTVPDWREEHTE